MGAVSVFPVAGVLVLVSPNMGVPCWPVTPAPPNEGEDGSGANIPVPAAVPVGLAPGLAPPPKGLDPNIELVIQFLIIALM
jgi:hypothetical protein